MEIIKEVLTKAFDVNLSYVVLLDIVLGFLYLFNILLGTIIGTKENNFNIKKFLFGILKSICVLLIVLGICYILNVFALTLSLLKSITINMELVTTLEIVTVLVTDVADISKELIEKIKSFRDLKFVSSEDVIYSDTDIAEPFELKG